jgi:plastocyanin
MPTRATITRVLLTLAVGSACGGGESIGPTDNTVTTVTISGQNKVAPGSTVQLATVARNAGGTTITGLSTSWSSSATSVATVNSSGLVSGLTNGSAEITGTVSGVSGKMTVLVAPIAASNDVQIDVANGGYTTFSPDVVTVNVGGTVTWKFTLEAYEIHNVTFDPATGVPANIPDTPNGSVSRTFGTVGTFNYQCTRHAGMTGKVVVQ